MSPRLVTTALAALLCGLSVPALAQSVAITNARLVIGDGSAPVVLSLMARAGVMAALS